MRNFRLRGQLLALCLGMSGSAMAQNQAFSDRESSGVEYWLTPYEAFVNCDAVVGLSGEQYRLDSAVEQTLQGSDTIFCKVDGVIPGEIGFQVNLPERWNGRIYLHGNGGNGGLPADNPRRRRISDNALRQGFAVAYSNSGHDAETEPGISFAFNNPEKKQDYAGRATAVTQLVAAEIVATYYQRESDYDYFDGCSWGGHQGFAMAQRFPGLFDGILAGAPVFNFTGLHAGHRQLFGVLEPDWPGPADTEVVAQAILAKCDALDGLEDGVLQDPRACEFDPATDIPACDAANSENYCMSQEMRDNLAYVYKPVIVAGEVVAAGRPVSAELTGYHPPRGGGMGAPNMRDGWDGLLAVSEPGAEPFILGRLEDAVKVYLFPDDMSRDWQEFDLERSWRAVKEYGSYMDEVNPDLGPLRRARGKLLAYHGWADFNVNPNLTYEYFEEVYRRMGAETARDTARLFMVPGMFHCRGGTDVFQFDGMTSLINWVERGEAPDKIMFSGNADYLPDRQRPVCAFPAVATYTGGDSEAAGSFECK